MTKIEVNSDVGAGIIHKGHRFITHSRLHESLSAVKTFSRWQAWAFMLVLAALAAGFALKPLATTIWLIAILSVAYFADTVFHFYLVGRSMRQGTEISFSETELARVPDETLPVYTILCPLYREGAVLPAFLKGLAALDWPKDKLEVLLLLEEDDRETAQVAARLSLPPYVKILVVPHSLPKTKPKACNYGLAHAQGEYLVIYDAEDLPEPEQLKKAYCGFQRLPANVKCLQAKLNYYNPHHNLLTRLFTAEYSLWFDVILTGLQSMNTAIPLGGTSNHFRTEDLRGLHGWDAFNVTEDCDLGMRLFKGGFRTAMIDSITLEEANSDFRNWMRQRSRWIKGYIQTYLVHMRQPLEFWRRSRGHALIFQLVIGGKIAFLFINPFLWATTIAYFAFRAAIGPTIESFFPPVVFYIAVTSLILGNFFFLYSYMIGLAKRRQWHLIKYVFLAPAYWLMASMASVIALYQLLVKPHFWEKTHHGLAGAPAKEPKISPGYLPEKRIFGPGVLFMGAMMATNFFNFLFNAFLGRVLDFHEFAVVTLVNTLWFVASLFIGAAGATVNYRVAFLAAAGKKNEADSFFARVLKSGFVVAAVLSAIWAFTVPLWSRFFNLPDSAALFLFTPVFTFGLILIISRAYLQGKLRFAQLAGLVAGEGILKLVLAGALVWSGFPRLAFLALPASVVSIGAISLILAMKERGSAAASVSGAPRGNFPWKFYGAVLLASVSVSLFLSLDILLVNHFLPAEEAGQYALLALVGKMIYFFGSLPGAFLLTLVSRDEGLRKSPRRTFNLLLAAAGTFVAIGFLGLGIFGTATVPFLLGAKSAAVAAYFRPYALAISLFTIGQFILTYNLAKRRYAFAAVSLCFSAIFVGLLTYRHNDVDAVVRIVLAVSAAQFAVFGLLHFLQDGFKFARAFFVDLRDVFFGRLPVPQVYSNEAKRILVFNWRDTRHVFGGGAEVYIHALAREWTKSGNFVTIFCGNDGKSPRHEIIDGVNIVRRGGFYFVYFWAFVYYIFRFRRKYDLIIDCENGVPFFAPFYAAEPVVCLMHHVHQEIFRTSLSRPLAAFASFLEKDLMPMVYRKTKFITVSASSRDAIQKIGLGGAGIEIVSPGVDTASLFPGPKARVPTVLYLGRLKAYKSLHVLIKSFELVLKKHPCARLVIAGGGEEEDRLKKFVREMALEGVVTFKGVVSHLEKIVLLQKAWVFVNPSMMEGWGITTIEANACGTPIVAANVPGLRDSVNNPHTGYLVPYGDHVAMSERISELLEDKFLRERMGVQAVEWARRFDWQESAKKGMKLIIDYSTN